MLNYPKCEEHVLAWLRTSRTAGIIEPDPESRVKFADLYALYLRTVQDTRSVGGKPLAKGMFALFLSLNDVNGVYGTGNVAYRQGIRIIPAS